MNEQDPSEKFFQPEPKLPDMYVLWLELAQVAHKLEPFARGDRTPAAINAAREARTHLKAAQHELVETELFISAQIRATDQQREQALSAWENEVDRPDLVEQHRQDTVDEMRRQMNNPQPDDIPFDAGKMPDLIQPTPEVQRDWEARQAELVDPIVYRDASGQPRANTDALVGHVRQILSPDDVDCYLCGHPRGAHRRGVEPGPCGTIVEHGYLCDCPKYIQGQARPVAEIHDKPASYGQLMEVCDDLELEDGSVRTEVDQCASCGHSFQSHPAQGGQCQVTWPINGDEGVEHCLCAQYHPTYKFECPGVAEADPDRCEHCHHGRDEHKFQGCINYDPQKGNCACLQYTAKEAQTP